MAHKRMIDALRGARKIEWILLVAAIAVAALLLVNNGYSDAPTANTELEARIESVLSMVEGAGRVRILVNEEAADQAVFASSGQTGAAKGVVIVAEGAGDLRVSLELARAVKTLLGIELENIEVLTMDGGMGS